MLSLRKDGKHTIQQNHSIILIYGINAHLYEIKLIYSCQKSKASKTILINLPHNLRHPTPARTIEKY